MSRELYTQRRNVLFEKTNHPIILTAHKEVQRSNDAAYAFEQDANFSYLTGINEADWILVVEQDKSWLIAPTIDEIHQIFDGSLSWESAKEISGVDHVVSRDEGRGMLEELAKHQKTVSTIGVHPHEDRYGFAFNPAFIELRVLLLSLFDDVQDSRITLAKMRAIKQPEEIAAMRRAIALTVEAFASVRKKIETYAHEYEIEADFTHAFRFVGADGHAYDPIVAAGKNACTLHYGANQSDLQKSQLVLIDVGARVDGYAADITRTYSLGSPTARQKQVHAAVENAHKEIIALLKPQLAVSDYHEQVDVIMKRALDSLGLLKSDKDYRRYFPHAISHGLGIDVHDSLGSPEVFLPGMVLTVEPGIYIPEEEIGVRIEDDILITESGHENLSAALSTSL